MEPFTSCVTLSKSPGLSGLDTSWEPAGEWVPGALWPRLGWGMPQVGPSLCSQRRDAGTYICTAENPVGRARRRTHLTILALPVFTTLPGDRSLHLGDRLWLRCAARGSPTPRIGWTINDRPVTGLDLLGAGGWRPGAPEGGHAEGGASRDPQPTTGRASQAVLWILGL